MREIIKHKMMEHRHLQAGCGDEVRVIKNAALRRRLIYFSFPIGDEGVRTPDPLNAIQVLSQLSYIPVCPIDKLPENAGPVKRKIRL